jgi:hypothetical protein
VEFGLQRDYLLGQHCGGVEQPNNDTRHNVIMSFKCSGASRLPATAARGKWQSRGESGDVAEFDRNEERLEERPVERPDSARTNHDISANVKMGYDIGPLTFSDQLIMRRKMMKWRVIFELNNY